MQTLRLGTRGSALARVQAADLTVRLDARDVARKHVHTDLTLSARPGPLTLVFPEWIPGEHGPTGPIDTLVGMVIRANGQALTWQRDPTDMYAISVTVPAGASGLEIALESGLPIDDGAFCPGPQPDLRVDHPASIDRPSVVDRPHQNGGHYASPVGWAPPTDPKAAQEDRWAVPTLRGDRARPDSV